LPSISIFCYVSAVGTNVNMNISTGNSSHRTLARPETLGCHIGTRQNILPDFMYELDKKLPLASMFDRSLFFSSHARWQYHHHVDCRLSLINSSHPHPIDVLRSYIMLCKYASTSNLTWSMQTRPSICFGARYVLNVRINTQILTPSVPDDRRGLVGVVTMPVHCAL
jgi:hypothetical protein